MCGKTKKIILLAVILSFVQLLIFSGTSFSTIVESGHDLSVSGLGNFKFDTDQVCIFCHTPHKAIVLDSDNNRLPLWNRSISGNTSGFALYSSSTLNAAPGQPRSMTLLCLSCHDGTSALNVVQNFQGGPATFDILEGKATIGEVPGLGINIGDSTKDLSNDHPVSFVYDTNLSTSDGGLKDPATISPLRLFNNRLECATCHNPHEQGCIVFTAGVCDSPSGTYPFLRMSNLNSDMCVKCHNK